MQPGRIDSSWWAQGLLWFPWVWQVLLDCQWSHTCLGKGMSLPCSALVLPHIPAQVHFISILRVTLRAKNTECCVHKYHTLSLAVSFPENLGIRNKSSPVAHCLLHLSVVFLCLCLALVLLAGFVFHLPVVLVQQERFTKGLGEGVQTLIAGAPVAQVLLTHRTEVVGSVTWHHPD